MKRIRPTSHVLRFAALLLLAGGVMACSTSRPAGVASLAISACEPGSIEQARSVVRDLDGIALGDKAFHAPGGRYRDPTDDEVRIGMLAAATTGIREDRQQEGASRRLGTAYLVRLNCGGVVYVFEEGPQRFEEGRAVAVQHGLAPTLHDR